MITAGGLTMATATFPKLQSIGISSAKVLANQQLYRVHEGSERVNSPKETFTQSSENRAEPQNATSESFGKGSVIQKR